MPIYCHLSQLIQRSAEKRGEKSALRYRDYTINQWRSITWRFFAHRVDQVAQSLLALEVKEQENVAVFAPNKPESLFVEFGAFGVRAAITPFYATSSGAQVQYMMNDASIRIIFVGEQQQYDAVWSVLNLCQSLEHIVLFGPDIQRNSTDRLSITFEEFLALGAAEPRHKAEVERRRSQAKSEDIANILYTSGTTGQPKGVVILHSQYDSQIRAHLNALPMTDADVSMSFLPFCHIFEGAWVKVCLSGGIEVAINQRPLDIQQSLREVRPTLMCAVPRFWEKVYQGVLEKIEQSSPLQARLMRDALRTGVEAWEKYTSQLLPLPLGLKMKLGFYRSTVIRLLRNTLGLDRVNFLPVAGATVSPAVERFVHAAGFDLLVGYGLTESCATVTFDQPGKPVTLGSIGRPIEGVEVRIGEGGEIQARGRSITPGYYKQPQATAEAFTEDGWFKTGDAGYLKDGELYITERIKDLFKTSNGKYIAPQAIEGKITIDRHFDQVVIVADQRKFVAALIVPNYAALEAYAQKHDLAWDTREQLCKHPAILQYVSDRIATLQQELAGYERIKRFTLLPEPFTMEKGELTNTLKIKRRVIYDRYAEQIAAMYAEE